MATNLASSSANGVANGRSLSNAKCVAMPTLPKGGGGCATPRDTKPGMSVASCANTVSSHLGEIFLKLEPPGYFDVATYNTFVIENAPFSERNMSTDDHND